MHATAHICIIFKPGCEQKACHDLGQGDRSPQK